MDQIFSVIVLDEFSEDWQGNQDHGWEQHAVLATREDGLTRAQACRLVATFKPKPEWGHCFLCVVDYRSYVVDYREIAPLTVFRP